MPTTYIRLTGVAEFVDAPGQPIHTKPTAPAANASAWMIRFITYLPRHEPQPSAQPGQPDERPAGIVDARPAGRAPSRGGARPAARPSAAADRPASASTDPSRATLRRQPPPARRGRAWRAWVPPRPAPPGRRPGHRRSAGTGAGAGARLVARPPTAPRSGRRSASRIRIGYNVPDASPVCLASRYPCSQEAGSASSAASTDNVWAENPERRATTRDST